MSVLKQTSIQKWSISTSEADVLFNNHLETVKNDFDIEEYGKLSQNLVDEKEEEQQDEPKIFQDEEILDEHVPNDPVWLKKKENYTQNKSSSKLTSVLPTPLACSRSSSLTSLNSFDVKSIHSTVDSEYSHATKNGDSSHLDDDIDNLLPDSPAAPDTSFLKAQRTIHKKNQDECRQNALKISYDLKTFMTRLVINEPVKICPEPSNTPPVKLVQVPKFLQSNPQPPIQPQPVMSVTYGFLKNVNPIIAPTLGTQPTSFTSQPPKFLLSSQSYNQNNSEDSPKVYSTLRLRADSPQESICSQMSDASLPSLIRQDISHSHTKFNTVLNNNPNFKVLFEKLNEPKNQLSSSSSESSCSSVVPKFNEEVDEDEDEESSILDTTTKPMNTPAGFASVSGSSFVVESDSEEQEEEGGEDKSKSELCLYIDCDLENFIKENFQPKSNEDLEERKFSKRASLQSLDFNSNKAKSKSSMLTNKKRLSEDNLKIPTFSKKLESVTRQVPKTTTPLSNTASNKPSTKQTTLAPVVNMNKTAQLRASKLSTTTATKSTISKPLDKKTTVNTSQPRVNNKVIPSKTVDRFNTTVNENETRMLNSLPSHLSQSRRVSISGSNTLSKKEPVKKTVLSSLNKDLNTTVSTSSTKCGIRPKVNEIVKTNVSSSVNKDNRTYQAKMSVTKTSK